MRIATILGLLVLASPALAASPEPPGASRSMGLLPRHHRYHHYRHHDEGIEIPDYVGHVGHAADQLPPGTTRPGRSRNFIPAR